MTCRVLSAGCWFRAHGNQERTAYLAGLAELLELYMYALDLNTIKRRVRARISLSACLRASMPVR